MLPRERQLEIAKLVNREGTVKTSQLADKLNCTEETIRRDLDALEKEKKIVRSHGGAMSVQDSIEELQHHKRETREVKEKQIIGAMAASHIREGELIFIDESSTALAMVDHLPLDKEFELVTTSLLVAKRVSKKSNITLYLLGGLYDEKSHSFGGLLTEEAAKNLSIDRFFLSAKGVAPDFGASEANEERARSKKNLLKFAAWKCVLADHTKLGIKAKFSFILPQEIDLLITDDKAPQLALDTFDAVEIQTQKNSK